MTKKEIMLDTFRYYEEDPSRRAVTSSAISKLVCQYITEDNRMCAVGRYLDWGKIHELGYTDAHINNTGDVKSLVSDLNDHNDSFWAILKPEVCVHDAAFWYDLQRFHDNSEYWSNDHREALRGDYKRTLLLKWEDR